MPPWLAIILFRINQLDTPHRNTVFRFRRTHTSLSATVPGSVAHWKITCGSPSVPASAIETSAGLRWSDGRERIRVRSAWPSVQAVVLVNDGKIAAEAVSWAVRVRGYRGMCC